MIRKSGNRFSEKVMRKKTDALRRSQRLIAATVLVALSGALAGCSSGLSNWDPSDLLDFLDTKKKLPGERKPVFPDGVPGLQQGVPKELYKGAAQEQIDQQNAEAAAAASAPAPEEPKSKHGSKSNGKSKPPAATASTARDTAAAPDADAIPEEDGSTAAAPPAPKPKKTARKRITAPPADPTGAQAAPPAQSAQSAQQPQQSSTPFPAPLPGGTFTR
jgi:hypothetical protein